MKRQLTNWLLLFTGVVVVAGINAQIIWPWFGKDGPANIGSIEVSYITMARFWNDFGAKSWVPQWYLGYPMGLNYVPVVPMTIGILNGVGMGYWQAYRALTGVSYILVPLGVMLLVWQLTKNWVSGVLAAVVYSVGPTIFYWLEAGVAADRFSADFWDPRRFTILVRWGEGPHTVALIFVPLAGFFLTRFWETKRRAWLVGVACAVAMAGLSNALGMFAAVIVVMIMAFVRSAQAKNGKLQIATQVARVMAMSGGLVSFWYNPAFIKTFFGEGGGFVSKLANLFPWGLVGVGLAMWVVYWIVGKVIKDFGMAVTVLFAGIFMVVVGVYYRTNVELLPQALRYTTEADMGLAMVVGTVFAAAAKRKNAVLSYGLNGLGVILVFGLLVYVQVFVPTANKAVEQGTDVEKSGEKDVARWLEGHIDKTTGERVWVTGNHGFYLNYFSDVPQIRGALYQASENSWPDDVHYQLVNGQDKDITEAWLDVLGVKYVVLPGPASAELYKEKILRPEKFTALPVVAEFGGNTVYDTGFDRGLARVVDGRRMEQVPPILKADAKEALLEYANVLKTTSSNPVVAKQVNEETYRVIGQAGEGEKIVVAVTHDGGWKARGAKIEADPLGLILLSPKPGKVDIELKHGVDLPVYAGYIVFLSSLVGIWVYLSGRMDVPGKEIEPSREVTDGQ